MKICIPTTGSRGLDETISPHFGSAPFFTIVDIETSETEFVANANGHHAHGSCHPLAALGEKKIFAIICAGMGRRAIAGLNAAGIKAFFSDLPTVRQSVEAFQAGRLREMDPETACAGHGCH